MDSRTVTSEYRLAHWSGIIRERQSRGMTIKDFCKTEGLHENTYFYWQRKLREVACEVIKESGQQNTVVPQGWTACEVLKSERVKESSEPGSLSIEIGKCRIRVGNSVDSEHLLSVCRTLLSLC